MAALSPAPGHELFIYYRAEPQRTDVLRAAVGRMQSALCGAHAGLEARLLHRPDLRDGLQTWMETYRLPPGTQAVALAAEIECAAEALCVHIVGPRHVEHFLACAS
jgi:hypothetical protein